MTDEAQATRLQWRPFRPQVCSTALGGDVPDRLKPGLQSCANVQTPMPGYRPGVNAIEFLKRST